MKTLQLTAKSTIYHIVFNSIALAFIYFVPTISHLLSFPMYLIEPMRIALILAMVHTTKVNAYVIAITLPLFSYLVSGHPVFYKMLLISGELMLNVWFFYLVLSRTKNAFASIFSSIVFSKMVYYLAKFVIIALIFKSTESIVSTPLYIQLATTLVFSIYLGLVFGKEKS
jgi:hypothetical protein